MIDKENILKEFKEKTEQQEEMPEDIQKIVDENFWELIEDKEENELQRNKETL